jgi:hypothetical protein
MLHFAQRPEIRNSEKERSRERGGRTTEEKKVGFEADAEALM